MTTTNALNMFANFNTFLYNANCTQLAAHFPKYSIDIRKLVFNHTHQKRYFEKHTIQMLND